MLAAIIFRNFVQMFETNVRDDEAHDAVDYALIAQHAKLIVDTRNVFERLGIRSSSVVKA